MELQSKIDHSVNWVLPSKDGGALECRFVHRPNTDYFMVYVSSHTGCNKACRMCFLTQTGQTMMKDATYAEIFQQVAKVFSYAWMNFPHLKKCHINFMARGEPLANANIADAKRFDRFIDVMVHAWPMIDISVIFSTIMPFGSDNLKYTHPKLKIYYSLYSVDDRFRRKWLPNAYKAHVGLAELYRWHKATGNEVRIHFPLIAGENDSELDIFNTLAAIDRYFGNDGIKINLIQYNPPNDKSRESDFIQQRVKQIQVVFPRTKLIGRVGKDVYASCGMFPTIEGVSNDSNN